MAKVSAKGAVITIDNSAGAPEAVSKDCKSFDIEYAVNPLEVTGFTEGAKNFTPGLLSTGVTLDFYWNTVATVGSMTVLKGIIGLSSGITVSIVPESGSLTYSGEFMCDGISPKGGVDGVIELGSVHFSVVGSTAPTWA